MYPHIPELGTPKHKKVPRHVLLKLDFIGLGQTRAEIGLLNQLHCCARSSNHLGAQGGSTETVLPKKGFRSDDQTLRHSATRPNKHFQGILEED